MASLGNVNMKGVEPGLGGGGVIPNGDYKAIITGSQWKKTKKQDGEALVIEFTVQAGEHRGAKLSHWLNLQNKSTDAVSIAKQELAYICKAMGIDPTKVQDSQMLHNIPLILTVVVDQFDKKDATGKLTGEKGNSNKIRDFLPSSGAKAAKPTAQDNSEPDDEQGEDDDNPFSDA